MVPNSVQVPPVQAPTNIQANSTDHSPAVDQLSPSIQMPATSSISPVSQTHESTDQFSPEAPISNEKLVDDHMQEEPKLRHFYVVDSSTSEPENPNQFVDSEVMMC